jgi:RNA polymerase primary sigma factor/RNA polymerase sigma factor
MIVKLKDRVSRPKTSKRESLKMGSAELTRRVEAALSRTIEYISHPEFDKPGIKSVILSAYPCGDAGMAKKSRTSPSVGKQLGGYVSELCFAPLLTKEQEQYLFRKMNYLRHLATLAQQRLARAVKRSDSDLSGKVAEFESLLAQADQTREHIVSANLRLVISIAKKYVNVANTFDELISEGNMSLLQAAEKFDISRGNRFSTYATRAIRNNLYHYVLDKHRKRQQVNLAEDEVLSGAVQEGTNEQICENRLNYVRRSLARIMGQLDEQKQAIIRSRFGLDYNQTPLTLKEIASDMGVSRERVRQIQTRAMRELRVLADREMIELPEYE